MFADDGPYHRFFRLTDVQTGTVFSDVIEVHTIELSKLTAADIARGDLLDRWAFFLRESVALDSENLPELLDLPEFRS